MRTQLHRTSLGKRQTQRVVMRERERDGEEFAGEDYKHMVFFYFGKGTWAPNATAAELDDPYARTEGGWPRSV